jgi:hypothetical protein
VHLLLLAVDAADPLVTGFCHVTAEPYLLYESLEGHEFKLKPAARFVKSGRGKTVGGRQAAAGS